MTTRGERNHRTLNIVVAAFLGLAATFAINAAAADLASAQLPAICDQYPGLPGCVEGEPGGGGDEPTGDEPTGVTGAVPGAGGPTAGEAAAGEGELPFTGYPLTPLLLLLLLLVAAGLTIRAYLAIRDRVRARSSGTPTGTA